MAAIAVYLSPMVETVAAEAVAAAAEVVAAEAVAEPMEVAVVPLRAVTGLHLQKVHENVCTVLRSILTCSTVKSLSRLKWLTGTAWFSSSAAVSAA